MPPKDWLVRKWLREEVEVVEEPKRDFVRGPPLRAGPSLLEPLQQSALEKSLVSERYSESKPRDSKKVKEEEPPLKRHLVRPT